MNKALRPNGYYAGLWIEQFEFRTLPRSIGLIPYSQSGKPYLGENMVIGELNLAAGKQLCDGLAYHSGGITNIPRRFLLRQRRPATLNSGPL